MIGSAVGPYQVLEELGADLCIDKITPFDEMCRAIRETVAR